MKMSKYESTNEVAAAADVIPDDAPYATELRNLLNRAVAEAFEDELYWSDSGKPHLRTFLNTTPVGIAIVELANAILESSPSCPYDFSHTRHWCGNNACRDS